MRIVGLTGGIGSGKSEVARIFASLGAEVIDADVLAREVVEPGSPALAAIVSRFGAEFLDASGRLDRKRVATLVFQDPGARAELEAIIHPAVRARAMERIAAAAEAGTAVVVYDVPLLYEAGLDRELPDVIVVDAGEAIRRERVRRRDGMSDAEIEARIAAQLPLAEKVRRARWVIDNSGALEETRRAVARLYGELARDEA